MPSGFVATGKFLLLLGFASALVLVFSMILDPFFALMAYGSVRDLLVFLFPKGMLIVIFLVGIAAYYRDIQRSRG